MQQKFNLLQFVLMVFVSCVATFCIVSFSGVLTGDKGDRGVPGKAGETVFVTYDYLNGIWKNNVGDVWDKYTDIADFFARYPSDNGIFVEGPKGESGGGSTARASNIAVQSAVDIITHGNFVSRGAGVIYDLWKQDGNWYGYIVTNYHVVSTFNASMPTNQKVEMANNILLRFYGASVDTVAGSGIDFLYNEYRYDCIPAEVVGGSEEHDVAVLYFSGVNNKKVAEVAYTTVLDGNSTKTSMSVYNSTYRDKNGNLLIPSINRTVNSVIESRHVNDSIRHARNAKMDFSTNFRPIAVGSQIFAVGNPLGNDMSVTAGVVSVQSEIFTISPIDESRMDVDLCRVIRVDCGINPGNSGGGIFDSNGDLVGIAMARMYGYGGNPVDNIAYVIPIEVVMRVADQVIDRMSNGSANDKNWSNKNPIKVKRFNEISVSYKDSILKYNETTKEVEILETVLVASAIRGAGNAVIVPSGTEIKTITLEFENHSKTYTITRAYQVDEIMLEAYIANSVKINDTEIPRKS